MFISAGYAEINMHF